MPSVKAKLLSKTSESYVKLCKFKKSDSLNKGFTITCHAGAMLTKPNSLKSVKEAVDWGAQIVEFDVSFRPDGTPVIIHNSAPSSNQGEYLYKALAIVAESKNCRINLDIKSKTNLPAVDKLVREYGLFDRVFYTGVFEDWVDTVRNTSEIPYYLNHKISKTESLNEAEAEAVAKKAIKLGAIGINSNLEFSSKLFTDIMHKNGLLVSLWTANSASNMIKCLDAKPDNITTKKPNLLKSLLK